MTNLAKSELVPVENVDNVYGLAWILGCGFGSLPLKCISLPLGGLPIRPRVVELCLTRAQLY